MTPLALALVACCAVVCGTVLVLAHWRYDREAALYSEDARRALADAGAALAALKQVESDTKALRADVESLRAIPAFRSM
jgi:hypothetical protein